MKYVAYRVTSQRIENNKVINAFSVLGQRSTDLNWDYISKLDAGKNLEDAMDEMFKANSTNEVMYDIHGYGVTR